jgi:hypothetical protein
VRQPRHLQADLGDVGLDRRVLVEPVFVEQRLAGLFGLFGELRLGQRAQLGPFRDRIEDRVAGAAAQRGPATYDGRPRLERAPWTRLPSL